MDRTNQAATMQRLTILAKGNADVAASLHMLREDGTVTWNGINEALRQRGEATRARVVHETMARSDAWLASSGEVPAALAQRELPLGAYPPAMQFSSRAWEAAADVVVLSIQPDVMNRLVRHRGDGHLLYPHDVDRWPEGERTSLGECYEPVPPLTPEQSMAGIEQIVVRLRQVGDPAILVFNMSPFVPGELLHSHAGIAETLGNRIRRFNLALCDLSRRTGISIVDVERILAGAGAERLKLDAVSFTAEGCRLVAEEVVRVLGELGRLGAEGVTCG